MLYRTIYAFVIALTCVTVSLSLHAQGLTFGLIAKSIHDSNFIDAWQGCQKVAQQHSDRCQLLGSQGEANPRSQHQILKTALNSNDFAALAISVTHSGLISDALKGTKIPIITFDSPLSSEHQHLSLAYVGANNVRFGEDLAKLAKILAPDGGRICLMTDLHDVNLSVRVSTIRKSLSNNPEWPSNKRLNNSNNWTEPNRCPWNAGDDVIRTTHQLKETLETIQPDILLAVGHWPLLDLKAFQNINHQYNKNSKTKIIVGIGKVLPEYQKLLDKGSIHGLVSIDFPETGKQAYKVMRAIVLDKDYRSPVHTNNIILMKSQLNGL